MYKLTKIQYITAGRAVAADDRCTTAIKRKVRQGTSGEAGPDGMYTYTPNSDCGRPDEWYDKIIASSSATHTP